MLEIKCPYCGKRSQNEFAYGGDATIKRPKLNTEVSDEEWDTFVYYRKNPWILSVINKCIPFFIRNFSI